jgi:photosystem II stability/assembly factor-like uncharacterized protein
MEASTAERETFGKVVFQGQSGWADLMFAEGLVATVDGGLSWRFLSPPEDYDVFDSIFFASPQLGWAATREKAAQSAVLLRTTDGGQTWEPWSTLGNLKVHALLDMQFSNDGSVLAVGMIMPGLVGVVLSSGDWGKTWDVRTSTTTLYDIVVGPDGSVWVAGVQQKILMSPDGGKKWIDSYSKTDTYIVGFRAVDSPTAGMAVAVGEYGGIVIRTTDQGKTWEHISLPHPYEDLPLTAIKFADGQHGWIAGLKGVVLFTSDGGKTWSFEDQLPTNAIFDIAITESKVIAVGEGAIFWRERPTFP